VKIEFYHIDAFEIANYEPIWRQLRDMGVDATLVAVPDRRNTAAPGWFDFPRFKAYCDERDLPFTTETDPTADIGITTQNASILRDYKKRVRLMYGPVLFPSAWGIQPHAVQPFDAVLTHGQGHADRFSQWLPRDRLPIVGYPRYDDFFAGRFNKETIRASWGVTDNRPVICFLPTWADNTGFDLFFPELVRLSDRYNIILRPHHCTLRMEPERMALMRASGLHILDSTYDLSACYAGADVIVSDVRSGGMLESCVCDVPVVGMVIDPNEMSGWLAKENIGQMVSLCSSAHRLDAAIDEALSSKFQAVHRQAWAERHVANRDGTAAEAAAEALIKLVVPSAMRSLSTSPQAPAPVVQPKQSYPVKVSIVVPTYNDIDYLPQALQSIINQTFDNYELIIVNDGSTDQTAAYLAGIKHPKIRVINKENGKLPAALNTGFAEARGEYWTWTSSDNVVGPTWLEELVKALDESPPEIGYALSYYANMNEKGQIIGIVTNQCFETQRMLLSNGNASFLYRSDIAKQTGLYDTDLNGAEDMDMWLRMSLLTRGILVETVLYYYRLHERSMTSTIPDKVLNATIRMIEKFVASCGGVLDVDRVFPGIAVSSNPTVARWQAQVWLAARFAQSAFWPVGAIVDILLAALATQYEPSLVGNVVSLLARNDAWEPAAEVVAACLKKDQSHFIKTLADIVVNKDKKAAEKIPFVTLTDNALSFDLRKQLSRAQLMKRRA